VEVKFYGPWFPDFKDFRSINDIISDLYGSDYPDFLFYYNVYGWSGRHSDIENLSIPTFVIPQNGISYYAVPKVADWIKRMKFDLMLPRFWSSKSWHDRIKLKATGYHVKAWILYDIMEKYREIIDCPIISFPHCINPQLFHDYKLPKIYDVFFLGTTTAGFYPVRLEAKKLLVQSKLKGEATLFAPLHLPYSHKMSSIYAQKHKELGCVYGVDYAKAMNQSKMTLTSGSMFNVAVPKYFEAMATKCLLLAPLPDNAEELGLRDGFNIVHVTRENLREKFEYYLKHEAERERIVENAYNTVMMLHTAEVRVTQLMGLLKAWRK